MPIWAQGLYFLCVDMKRDIRRIADSLEKLIDSDGGGDVTKLK